ncbi:MULTISPECIES: hypothetical protein [unclassified Xanthomonas]|uniref:hypothetical protein n=1 Tax=unclassified Xanthomonas TaxID=2643310 RepID=UPI0028831AEF|nr:MULTISPECIES: hypothetical protein [unclassified Xanthomonas]
MAFVQRCVDRVGLGYAALPGTRLTPMSPMSPSVLRDRCGHCVIAGSDAQPARVSGHRMQRSMHICVVFGHCTSTDPNKKPRSSAGFFV